VTACGSVENSFAAFFKSFKEVLIFQIGVIPKWRVVETVRAHAFTSVWMKFALLACCWCLRRTCSRGTVIDERALWGTEDRNATCPQ